MRITDLVQKMLHERHLGYPVLDTADGLVGMVTLSDIQGAEAGGTVEQVISRQVPTIPERGTALEGFQISRNNFGRLIVLGADKQIVGIPSKTDLIRAVQVRLVGLALQPESATG